MAFYAKGKFYGDADASVSLGAEARRAFLAQNGGHALLVIRSSNVYVNECKCYFSGSTGPLYVSSSNEVKITGCHSNPASDGFAAYAIDAWCGSAATAGMPRFNVYIEDCLLIAGDSIITVSSTTATGSILNWKSRYTYWENNTEKYVYTHVRLNLANCTIKSDSTALRQLFSLFDPSGGSLIDFLAFPDMLKGCYLTSSYAAYRLRRTFEVIGNQNIGLAGTNTAWEFRIPGNRPPAFPCLIIADDRTFLNVLQVNSGYTDAGDGTIKVTLLLPGDVRNRFTTGNKYSIIE